MSKSNTKQQTITPHTLHVPAGTYFANPEHVQAAMATIEAERLQGFRAGLKVYWKAALWSVLLSTALVMEGYDVGMINSYFGQSHFQERFGVVDASGHHIIPANWQAAINNAATIGEVIGLLINGIAQARFGARPTYIGAMIVMTGAIFIPVFSTSLPMLFAGELVCGIPWGIFQTLTTAYAAEILPLSMRGYLTSYVNMCWGFGLFLAAGVVRATLTIDSNLSWRLPFMLQWVWPVPLLIGALFAPESPWFYVRHGKLGQARHSLRRLAVEGFYTEEKLDQTVALMVHTDEMEKAESEGTGFRECFKGTNLRRTEISCAAWIIQFLGGQPICGFATQFLQIAGMAQLAAFDLQLAINSMYVIGTICSWICMSRFGRRTIYIGGILFSMVVVLLIGLLGFFIDKHPKAAYGVGGLMIALQWAFNVSVGPVCYTIVGEIPATRVRSHTIVIGRAAYLAFALVINQIVPRMLTPDAWNWGARCGFFWLGTGFLTLVYTYYRIPESRGRTFGELDLLFFNKVSARRFASTKVSELDENVDQVPQVEAYENEELKGGVEHFENVHNLATQRV